MLFYTALFIASVIVALVVLYLYNALVDVGKAVYQAILPSSRDNMTSHVKEQPLQTTINETKTPWGWKNHATPATEAKTHPAMPTTQTPWGWPGNDGKSSSRRRARQPLQEQGLDAYLKRETLKAGKDKVSEPTVGWPYRDESFDFAGEEIKVTRKTPRKTNLKKTGKPWGW